MIGTVKPHLFRQTVVDWTTVDNGQNIWAMGKVVRYLPLMRDCSMDAGLTILKARIVGTSSYVVHQLITTGVKA